MPPVTLTDDIAAAPGMDLADLLAVDQGLKSLEAFDPRAAKVVELLCFGGLRRRRDRRDPPAACRLHRASRLAQGARLPCRGAFDVTQQDQLRHRRAFAIFDELIDLPEADRAARLETLCAGDASLRASLEAMLAADDEAGEPLLQIAARASDSLRAEAAQDDGILGRQIGVWRITAMLGHGGMGAVYEVQARRCRLLAARGAETDPRCVRLSDRRERASCASARPWHDCSTRTSPRCWTGASRRRAIRTS